MPIRIQIRQNYAGPTGSGSITKMTYIVHLIMTHMTLFKTNVRIILKQGGEKADAFLVIYS
jgi:hypothetical protein